MVWGWGRYEYDIVRLNLIFPVCYTGNTSLADNNTPKESETEKKEKNERGYIKYYIPGGPLSLSKGINSGRSSYKPSGSNGGPVLLVTGSKCGSSSTSTFSSTGGPVSLTTRSKWGSSLTGMLSSTGGPVSLKTGSKGGEDP